MKRALQLLALLVGGVTLALLVATWRTAAAVKHVGLNATFRVLLWARIWTLVYRVPFSLALAILKNEGASVPHDGRYPLGDQTSTKGPALGPGQVLRINVDRLWTDVGWLYPLAQWPLKKSDELAEVGHERQALWVSVKVMREALDAAKGDVHEAARRYNGSGPAAELYADKADATRNALA